MYDLNFYIGYDSSQPEAAAVCRESMRKWVDDDLINYVKVSDLKKQYWRPRHENQSTEFSFTRFLVPHINKTGLALFCDSDFLWVDNPYDVLEYYAGHAVSVVKHNIEKFDSYIKMDDKVQTWYEKKNWSSLMLFNCDHEYCRSLTPEVVSNSEPSYLHGFEWADVSIGDIPLKFNYLINYYEDIEDVHAYHFTDGGPWHANYKDVPHADEWLDVFQRIKRQESISTQRIYHR